ncbi:MAG: MATE family efflux transporter [Deltaproteobacteria bacterium]|nr:MATE family efflux transporter [Deltaproteobacteria bacterium]MBW2017950.1 MATE family efflux transporter [Deltaproteobacteria bacterium]MBW2130805.1 MATE family efflux transporter [Deltaproteobacteria bacterium]MBW2304848.1 MATE family efflux transporter [Deltaproteobacteria bacterium]
MIERWKHPNGYRDVLAISLPLVASMGSLTLMQFTDRVFLANYSINAISAALPAGILSFTAISFFMGVATYTNAFVAQYTGARAYTKVGASLWQGIYFSLFSALFLASLCFVSKQLFNLIGHSPQVRTLEVTYFNILTLGAGLPVLGSALAAFYTGRGLTWTTMAVHMTGAAVNIPLDYCLINGVGPFPELGIVGAGIATVAAYAVIVTVLALLIFSRGNRRTYGTWRARRFDRDLFGRLMRYGLPSGIQFFLEISGFTFFIQMIGRLGDLELAASNIVLSIESLSFLPMVGFHIGNSTLVGQAVGRGNPEDGVYSTSSALHITLFYMMLISAVFLLTPRPLLDLFKDGASSALEYAEISDLGVILLRFVAVFCLFDSLNLIFSGAIKGAGDTRFIMWTVGAMCLGMMIIPTYLAVEVFGGGLFTVWTIATLYVCALGVAFMLRYKQGKWKEMRVIEEQDEIRGIAGGFPTQTGIAAKAPDPCFGPETQER